MSVDEFLVEFTKHARTVPWRRDARGRLRVGPPAAPGTETICPVAFLANALGHGAFRTGTFDLAGEALGLTARDASVIAEGADFPLIAVAYPKTRAALLAAAGLTPDEVSA